MTRRTTCWMVMSLGILLVQPAAAITINANYDPGGAGAVNPSFDLNAAQLTPIFNAAVEFYEDVFEDFDHTLNIDFWYADLSNLGDHDLIAQAGGRETDADIQIDTNVGVGGALRNYFFDPTPTDNSEFDMAQTLWRDLSGTQRSDWFNNFAGEPIPDTFEVGFGGPASTGSAAQGAFDIYSLVLHEMGHALGLSGANVSSQNETTDGDYDFNSNFVFGQNFSAETVDQATDFVGHLDATVALMFPSLGGNSQRKLPSHTDLLAMAAGHSYDIVDAPRREFYGGGNWNNNFNWTGSRDPDFNDDAFVRDSQGSGTVISASLSANGSARNLTVSEGANVDLNSFRLSVIEDLIVTGLDTDVFVNAGGELEVDEIFIQDQAEIQMTGGLVDARRLTIDEGAQLEGVSGGSMTIDVSQRLVNNGVIDVDGGTVMRFVSAATSAWDLDGAGDGQLFANGGNLIFDTGGVTDPFGGEITVNAGFFLRIDADWSVDSDAVLDLNGGSGPGNSARIVGGTVTISDGTIDVDDVGGDGLTDGKVEFDAPVEITGGTFSVGNNDTLDFDNTTTVENGTFTLANNATINFDGATTVDTADFDFAGSGEVVFNGPTTHSFQTQITSNGLVRQDGDATIIGSMTVDGGIFDLDGTAGNTTIVLGNISNNGSLILNVDGIDTNNNAFNGTIETAEAGIVGVLVINLPNPSDSWTMAGTLNLAGVGGPFFQPARIAGTKMVVTGTVNVANNRVAIAADTDFNSNSTINTAGASAELIMRGVTVVAAGADFNGLGTLVNDFSGDMTLLDGLNTDFVDLDNEGTLRLGSSPGQVEVNGFAQTSSGVWEVEVAGFLASEFDTLTVDATAELAGTITLSLLDGFVPSVGQTFDILTAPFGVSGTFDTVLGGVAGSTRLGVVYQPTVVRLFATFSADFDLDGDVDADDLAQWQGDHGLNGMSDADGDGDSDGSDLLIWQQQLGSMLPTLTSSQAVPEPSTILLLLSTLVCLSLRGRLPLLRLQSAEAK